MSDCQLNGRRVVVKSADRVSKCQWYALCENPADGVVEHPAFPAGVPCCERCAQRHDLELVQP